MPAPPLVLVGPATRRNQASDDGGGPAGPSIPTSQGQVNDAGFVCGFPGCNRLFPTIRGKGVHQQRTPHKDWYDTKLQPAADKVRWSVEEVAMLARKEAQIITESQPRFMNQELQQYFPQRTIEAIKGKRRNWEYKEIVQKFINELVNPAVPSDPDMNNETSEEEFLDFLESLREPRNDQMGESYTELQ